MKRSRLFWGVALAAALVAGAALAEKTYYTSATQPVGGSVMLWLNASGRAVPVSAATPFPITR